MTYTYKIKTYDAGRAPGEAQTSARRALQLRAALRVWRFGIGPIKFDSNISVNTLYLSVWKYERSSRRKTPFTFLDRGFDNA